MSIVQRIWVMVGFPWTILICVAIVQGSSAVALASVTWVFGALAALFAVWSYMRKQD